MKDQWILIFILLFSMFNQWIRWLPVYLSSVTDSRCDDYCLSIPFTPICEKCIDSHTDSYIDSQIDSQIDSKLGSKVDSMIDSKMDSFISDSMNYLLDSLESNVSIPIESIASCESCHQCRINTHSEKYNYQDGICMNTQEYGLMNGFAFTLSFSLFGLCAGWLVDSKASRVISILGICSLLTGVITILTNYLSTFHYLLILRSLLGALQAFSAPASISIMTTFYVDTADRSIGNAAYSIGVYLGAGLSSLSTIFSSIYGWRFTCLVTGYSCIVVSLLYELIVDFDIISIYLTTFGYIDRQLDRYVDSQLYSQLSSNIDSKVDSKIGSKLASKVNSEITPLLFTPALYETDDDSFEHSGLAFSYFFNNKLGSKIDSKGDSQLGNKIVSKVDSKIDSDIDSKLNILLADEYVPTPKTVNIDSKIDDKIDSKKDSKLDSQVDANVSTASKSGISIYHILCRGTVPYAIPLLLLGSGLRFMGGIAIFVYTPVVVSRKYPIRSDVFSVFNAIVVLSCGSLSAVIGGKLGQRAVQLYGMRGLTRLLIYSCILSISPFIVSLLVNNFWLSMSLLALGYLIGEAWMGASLALLQGLSPKRGQGLAMSMYLFINWNSSALMTDLIGSHDPGTTALTDVLSIATTTAFLLSAFVFSFLDRLLVIHNEMKLSSNPVIIAPNDSDIYHQTTSDLKDFI